MNKKPEQVPIFEALSRDVTTRFLQSVVVVDDRAFLHEADRVHPHDGLIGPGMGIMPISPLPTENADTVDDQTHELDAKNLIDVFAEKGIVCGILRPKLDEKFYEKTLKAVQRADIVILDWQLQGKGAPDVDATDLITKIMYTKTSLDRVMLIAVYSAEKPSRIQDKIESTLTLHEKPIIQDDNYTFIQNATRICLFAKEGTIGADSSRIVRTEELPDRLIKEFTKMTMGLLSNAALESMAALRLNTHRILRKFHSGLDAPYLSHRILSDPPEEAETHVIPLIASEIQSVLDDSKISDLVGMQNIQNWLKWQMCNKPPLYRRMHIKSKNSSADAEKALVKLLQKGINNVNSSPFKPFKKWKKLLNSIKNGKNWQAPSKLTDIFTLDGKSGSGVVRDRELALLMSTRSQYLLPPPILTLGTIVAKDTNGVIEYYICVQPKCDCLRVPFKGQEFTFLPLDLMSKTNPSGFSHVVRDGSQIMELQLNKKLHASMKIRLVPLKRGQPIYACLTEKDWIFNPSETNALRWIGELKRDHAQRVSHNLAQELSRVGLIESEWLRRCAKRG